MLHGSFTLYSQTGTLQQSCVVQNQQRTWETCRALDLHVNKLNAHKSGSYTHILVQQHISISQASVQAQHALIRVMVRDEQKRISSEAARLPGVGPKQPRRRQLPQGLLFLFRDLGPGFWGCAAFQ